MLPCLRRIQEDRGYVADEDIDELAAYLGVPRIQIEEVLTLLHAVPARADRPLAPAGLPQRVAARCAAPSGCSTTCARKLGVKPGETTRRRPLHAVDGRVPGLLRHRAGGDGQRRLPREHERRRSSTRCSEELRVDMPGRQLHR
ncbi:MAG: NAD(P)H-dependent oxidoreductase subunit E [Ignavibacteriales bacterium]|nr:NAD(P)H-dependent oxidoreductase subunit E [Ignavibacteriales bacterium]